MDRSPTDAPTFAARRTRLLGREQEVQAVLDAVDAASQSVVTITGVGGSGKTSLAVEVGHRLVGQFGRRWFVDLTVVDHPEDVVVHVLHEVGLRSSLGDPHDVLAAELRRGPALIVLDNCEHVLDAAAHLVAVVAAACPELTLVATSRRPLDVPGERRLSLGPLPLTDDGAPGPAVRLLTARANALGAHVDPTGPEGAALLSVCRRLDGLPLPLVLAATQLRSVTPAELDARLAEGLRLPAMRGGTAHQRTMTASLDWSLDLLTPTGADLYRRLGAFVGGFDAALARDVCAPGTPPVQVTQALGELVDHSLLAVDTAGVATRYRMLAVVREHARAHLDDEARTEVTAAHRRAVLARISAQRDRDRYFSPDQIRELEELHDDVVAAIDSAIAARDAPTLVALLTGTIRFWRVTGRIRFGLDRSKAAIAVLEGSGRAVLEYMLADQERILGLLDDAAEHAHDALERIRRGEPAAWLPFAIAVTGDVAAAQGRFDDARDAYRQVRALYDPQTDPRLHALWCANLGGIELEAGQDAAAEQLLEEAREIFAVHPPVWLAGRVQGHLGVLARRRGDFGSAATLLLGGLDDLAPYNALAEAAPLVDELALVLAATGRAQDAADCHRAAAEMRRRMGSPEPEDTETMGGQPALSIAEVVALGRRTAFHRHGTDLLTPRELEVAELVADGLTNPQIAERLVISPGTARTHVERIRTKLGVGSRVQVARWVLEEYVERQTR
ncbi:putative ATPase [Isoptericola sp. CG 20/1183]|uniref:ATPase n=1 Tax=Isoptericola halotolerans TaxID=300560 RepID=A0ABX5ECF2_9MICO|nr:MULTISPECIES: LuxR C-terminal-related transcriptional regulator [Isoptericola]PRZ05085.1 putative ATPase [Isoptericola halotolerans]PRZ05823.1 putative ATPase [Isoptericola sp. CG 20/1183]